MMQQLLVGGIVLCALVFISRRVWHTIAAARAPKSGAGCDSGCGCAPAAPSTGDRGATRH